MYIIHVARNGVDFNTKLAEVSTPSAVVAVMIKNINYPYHWFYITEYSTDDEKIAEWDGEDFQDLFKKGKL